MRGSFRSIAMHRSFKYPCIDIDEIFHTFIDPPEEKIYFSVWKLFDYKYIYYHLQQLIRKELLVSEKSFFSGIAINFFQKIKNNKF